MVIGAAGELPKPPEKPIVFLEGMLYIFFTNLNSIPSVEYIDQTLTSYLCIDMDDSELAQAVRCYPHSLFLDVGPQPNGAHIVTWTPFML